MTNLTKMIIFSEFFYSNYIFLFKILKLKTLKNMIISELYHISSSLDYKKNKTISHLLMKLVNFIKLYYY